jgi:hypothetical protein
MTFEDQNLLKKVLYKKELLTSDRKNFISLPVPAEKVSKCVWLRACGLWTNDISLRSHLYVCDDQRLSTTVIFL